MGSPQLTDHAELHGCSCKVGRADLESLLAETGLDADQDGLLFGVGEDAAARRLTDDLALVSTIDFFTPVIDDPYDFGRVAACNAASDAFATGAVDGLSALCVLGLPRDLTDVAAEILTGITDAIEGMDGVVAGGHTVLNPWPLAGAAVDAVAPPDALLTADGAQPGDRLYLTKPLGTQPAMGALRVRDGEFADLVRETATREVETVGTEALSWMTTPNRAAARAIREVEVSAATDVTGFGLAGQAAVMAERAGVGIEIETLPVIDGTPELSALFGYGLEDGESAETSGGLLVAVPDDRAGDLEHAFADRDVFFHHVGTVREGSGVSLDGATIEPVQR
ncbi:selenide, water dikinase SelD [Halococcus saccharolyticus]|uniref:Putative selenophosphate synthase n=1 Tax=Halococcus saccharolyticus DSM 5350 TaxID=1227455 RepID=M0MBP7_9EURY|nr:selenide, water dikinase SelD [Halococcus saccharolyticus]EMA43202.1 putative selenophosphate synthase [Halococcus saccharolyticus DSM 5350]